ncbi:DUF1269 domain-containing protein [Leucobacter sp. L43]|uniref:DUF1269 domain-containing protein n=1 Tax=Leucobacter sp. L43 TaxID=2798040 RepID=UPI001902F016
MADLIVISFDTLEDAEGAFEEVQRLNSDLVVELAGLALVTVDDAGKTRVRTPDSSTMVGTRTANGALFGTLLGVLCFVPVVGLAIGGALGALFGGLEKAGITREFRERVNTAVSEQRPTIVVYALKLTEDKFGEALAPFRGSVVQTSLSETQEKELAHDLTGAP